MQSFNAAIEHALAALGVHVLRSVTRHRCDNLDFVPRQKLRQTLVARFEQDGEIAAINYATRRAQRSYPFDEIAEIRNHFRRTPREIDCRNFRVGEPIDNAINRFARHDFLALWTGIHMAMRASQIAKLADIDLKNFRLCSAQSNSLGSKLVRKTVHEAP